MRISLIRSFQMWSLILVGCMAHTGCMEVGRLEPGFQPLPASPGSAPSVGAIPNAESVRRQQYANGLMRPIWLYAKVVDQYGQPVSFAEIAIGSSRFAWGNSKSWYYSTRTDQDGRFSFISDPISGIEVRTTKKGFTLNRLDVNSVDGSCANTTPDHPKTIVMWKNTGHGGVVRVKNVYPWARILVPYDQLRDGWKFDLMNYALVTDPSKPYDVEVKPQGGYERLKDLDPKARSETKWDYFDLIFPQGTACFVNEPQPSDRAPIAPEFPGHHTWLPPGVAVSDLDRRGSTTLRITGRPDWERYIAFKSRDGKMFGTFRIELSRYEESNNFDVAFPELTCNPTGDPTLLEHEMTDKERAAFFKDYPALPPEPKP